MELTKIGEYIAQIPKILVMLEQVLEGFSGMNQRWLNTDEASRHLTLSSSKITKMLNVTLIEGTHYYKREGKNIFDRDALDKWIVYPTANSLDYQSTNDIVTDVLRGI